MNSKVQTPADDLVAATRSALGDHPEDIMEMMRTASDALGWLSDIFQTIGEAAESAKPADLALSIIKRRSEYGKRLADDFANMSDYSREEMERAMDAAGIKHGVDHE